jgi:hypothetical protein
MVAAAFSTSAALDHLTILPRSDGSAEPPTITYWDRGQEKSKKIDVLAGDLVAGLQIAVSLKGVGFRDQASLGFGKNITGRLYELENETRRLHQYRPQSVVIGLYFVPFGSTEDKMSDRTPSGFADLVASLRGMTGRSDPHRQDEWHRIDLGFVGLYVPGDRERFTIRGSGPDRGEQFAYEDCLPRGVVRYFDVNVDPPRRGRPLVDQLLTLEDLVDAVAAARAGPTRMVQTWGDAEPDD